MEYTIRTKAEFNAETHRHVFGDFSWMSDIEPSLFFDKEVAGKVLRWANADDGSDRYLVKYFPKEYWQRRDCILDAVCFNGAYLLLAPEEYRRDEEIAEATIMHSTSDNEGWCYLSDEILGNKDFLLRYMKSGKYIPDLFCFDISETLRHDRDIAAAAFSQKGELYNSFPEDIQCDKDLLLLAIKNAKQDLTEVPPEMYDFPDVVDAMLESELFDDSLYFVDAIEKRAGYKVGKMKAALSIRDILALAKVTDIEIHNEADLKKALSAITAEAANIE